MGNEFMIGELSKRTNCKVQTIRYYEEIGVMPVAARALNNRRLYNNVHLQRLIFIRHSRSLGFSLDDIRELLSLSDQPDHSCDHVDQIAQNHLSNIQKKIEALSLMASEIERMISHCNASKVSDCRIIKVLADHSLCEHLVGEREPQPD